MPRAIIERDQEAESPVAKILVVDDEPNIREVVSLYLRRDGHSVIPAADGEEALRLYRQSQPDLVVLDLMLPKVSGLEVCRRIQADKRVPVVMLTAKGEEEDRIVGLGIGADDYIVKPFSPRELAARVEAVLRRVNEARSGAGAEKLMVWDFRTEALIQAGCRMANRSLSAEEWTRNFGTAAYRPSCGA